MEGGQEPRGVMNNSAPVCRPEGNLNPHRAARPNGECDRVPADLEPLLSGAQVSRLLGISRRTLESLIRRSDAPPHLLIGYQRRWRAADIARWLNNKTAEHEKPYASHSASTDVE